MLLSIAMIVKNEEKNIERCLKALKELENKISYEIVIVDTGSEDNTINIARRYTEKVYEHKWNNNFAEMRNKSISYCKGQWILILDADEVLDDAKGLVEFFKSGEYRKYNCASIKLKNLLSADEDNYALVSLYRLNRNTEHFFYKGRVHEQHQFIGPIGETNASFFHYGYSNSSYELMEYKYKRNLELLLKDLKEGYNLIYTYFQLAQTYGMARNSKEEFNAIKKSFELAKKEEKRENYLYVYYYYGKVLFLAKKYEESIAICEEGITYSNEYIDFYFILALSYYSLHKYKQANKYFDEYLRVHKMIVNGHIKKGLSLPSFSFCKKDDLLKYKASCKYAEEDYENVITTFDEIENASQREEIKYMYIYSAVKIKEYMRLFKFYEKNGIEDKDIESITRVIERIFIEDGEEVALEAAKRLFGLNEKIDLYIKIIHLKEKIEFNSKIISLEKFYRWKGQIIKEYFMDNSEFIEYFKELDKQDIISYLSYLAQDYKFLEIFYNYCKEKFMERDFDTLRVVICIEEVLLANNSIDDEKYEKLVSRAYVNKLNYINKVYDAEILKSEYRSKILSKYDNLWFSINENIKIYEINKLLYIKKLRTILKEIPEHNRVIELYINKMDKNEITEELVEEKRKILVLVEKLIGENKILEALKILIELNDIFKYNAELLNYIGVAYYMLGNLDEAIINLAISNTIDNNNFDIKYNFACVLEADKKLSAAKHYYNKAYDLCKDDRLKMEISNIINNLINE